MQAEENVSQGDHRKEVSLFGAFSIGYADVGADIHITFGLVAIYAGEARARVLAGLLLVTAGKLFGVAVFFRD